ncbi:MAG: sulfite exporter TauE/SafE family protein [Flavobacteriales bacterium]|nr:sulfite exporter TauE/SafE family protein [Flavobacteriales bacterium]
MDFAIIVVVSCLASLLTFFSGFGLGTILTPAFMLFFPVEIAIAMTGIVHFSNNLFKLGLIGKNINYPILLKFGVPAMFGGFGGALLLNKLNSFTDLIPYSLAGWSFETRSVNMAIAGVMIFFALFDLIPKLKKLEFSSNLLVPGGVLSGFFGGLSGHQGALRSAFLIKSGLTKEHFIATGVSVACLVDISRLLIYSKSGSFESTLDNLPLILSATGAAFIGAILGKQLLKKVTIDALKLFVGGLIIVLAMGLALGLF